MKLWRRKSSQSELDNLLEDKEEDTSDKLQKVDEAIHTVDEKLEAEKAAMPVMAKAVASARRVKYRVDSFTAAMHDGRRGANDHG